MANRTQPNTAPAGNNNVDAVLISSLQHVIEDAAKLGIKGEDLIGIGQQYAAWAVLKGFASELFQVDGRMLTASKALGHVHAARIIGTKSHADEASEVIAGIRSVLIPKIEAKASSADGVELMNAMKSRRAMLERGIVLASVLEEFIDKENNPLPEKFNKETGFFLPARAWMERNAIDIVWIANGKTTHKAKEMKKDGLEVEDVMLALNGKANITYSVGGESGAKFATKRTSVDALLQAARSSGKKAEQSGNRGMSLAKAIDYFAASVNGTETVTDDYLAKLQKVQNLVGNLIAVNLKLRADKSKAKDKPTTEEEKQEKVA